MILAWREACGDKPVPSAVIIDSRSCRSAPTCFGRGFDGGKKIKGIKIHLAVDKYGFPLAINVSPANRHDSKGIVPVLHQLAGFKGTALGDLSYRGQRLAGEALGITLQPSAGGHGGGWHTTDAVGAEAAVDRSGAAQGDPGDLVRRVLRPAASASSATFRLARSTPCSPGGPDCGAACSTA